MVPGIEILSWDLDLIRESMEFSIEYHKDGSWPEEKLLLRQKCAEASWQENKSQITR